MNKLSDYKEVFDVRNYYENIDYYLTKVIEMYKNHDIFIYEFLDKLFIKYKDNPVVINFQKDFSIQQQGCNKCYKQADYLRQKLKKD